MQLMVSEVQCSSMVLLPTSTAAQITRAYCNCDFGGFSVNKGIPQHLVLASCPSQTCASAPLQFLERCVHACMVACMSGHDSACAVMQ